MNAQVKIQIIGLVCLWGLMVSAQARLSFDNPRVDLAVDPLTQSVEVIYTFKHEGEAPLAIVEVKPSCSCIVEELEKPFYEPGEVGELKAIFDVRKRQGMLKKWIDVYTEGTRREHYRLELNLEVPPVIAWSEPMLRWKRGEIPKVQRLEARVHNKVPLRITSVTPENESMVVTWRSTDEKTYVIDVEPRDTDKYLHCKLLIKTDYPEEKPEVFTLYCTVK